NAVKRNSFGYPAESRAELNWQTTSEQRIRAPEPIPAAAEPPPYNNTAGFYQSPSGMSSILFPGIVAFCHRHPETRSLLLGIRRALGIPRALPTLIKLFVEWYRSTVIGKPLPDSHFIRPYTRLHSVI